MQWSHCKLQSEDDRVDYSRLKEALVTCIQSLVVTWCIRWSKRQDKKVCFIIITAFPIADGYQSMKASSVLTVNENKLHKSDTHHVRETHMKDHITDMSVK